MTYSFHMIKNKYQFQRVFMVKPGSYAERLQQAKLSKSSPISQQTTPQRPQQTPPRIIEQIQQDSSMKQSISQPVKPQLTNQMISNNVNIVDNGFPFSDEIYEHLKYIISKLTARVKQNLPLTPEELERFKIAVDAVIKDAREDTRITLRRSLQSNPPAVVTSQPTVNTVVNTVASPTVAKPSPRPLPTSSPANTSPAITTPPSNPVPQSNGEKDVFEALKGTGSTWNVPGKLIPLYSLTNSLTNSINDPFNIQQE